MTRAFSPLLSALCLSLLAGCPGPSSDSLSPTPSEAPSISASSSSAATAMAGQQLSFEVTARDPHGSVLSFSWSATLGTLGTPSSDDSSSRITWTAPACAVAGTTPVLTATVTNASQLTATQTFTVSGLPSCASWSRVSRPNSPHHFSQSTLLPDGRVLVSGGFGGDDDAEVYDPVTDQWSHAGPPGETHHGSTATLLPDGAVLVTGGGDANNPMIYNPTTNTWRPTDAMVTPRWGAHTATLLPNGKVLVAGGYVGAILTPKAPLTEKAELYDPATGTWSPTGSLAHVRGSHGAVLLPDGRVLMVGGSPMDHPEWSRTSELYDPATGTWRTTGAMIHVRAYDTPTPLLLGGKVFASGNDTEYDQLMSRDESYDPATGTWSEVGLPVQRLSDAAPVLLENGQVLFASGACEGFACDAASKLYDPITSTWREAAPMVDRHFGPTAVRLRTGQVLVVGGLSSPSAELYTP